jgi:hypothetical protein
VKTLLLILWSAFVLVDVADMSGCAVFGNPSSAPYITAAVDIAVATAEAKGIKATDINRIAKTALAADANTTTTLANVSSLINAKIRSLNLPAGDIAAADILETALTAAIAAKVGNNATVMQTQAAVATVLNNVIAATGG